MLTSGDNILALCQNAQKGVFIASPFIKLGAIKKILGALSTSVKLVVISRFRPEDVRSGVCDLSAVEALWGRDNSQILLHPMLHAKLYIVDDIAFSGSANLTARGMGWSPSNNIEILLEVDSEHENVNYTRDYLMRNSFVFTKDYFNQLAEYIPQEKLEGLDDKTWIPECLEPENLWDIYQQKKRDSIISTTYEAGCRDIQAIGVEPSQFIDKAMFACVVKTAFLHSEFYKQFQKKITTDGFSDEEAIQFIASLNGSDTNTPKDKWRAVKMWIRTFCDDLIIEAQAEIVRKAKRI